MVKLYEGPYPTAVDATPLVSDYQTTGTSPPKQTDFYAYQWWYKEYPDEVIVKTHAAAGGEMVIGIRYTSTLDYESVYPDNIVSSYDPGPPYYDPVPNPNGTTGTTTSSTTAVISDFNSPRWHTATEIDLSAYATSFPSFVPESGVITQVVINTFSNPFLFGGWSIDVSATNLDSEVLNLMTTSYEYYPFAQADTTYKQTAKFKVKLMTEEICCWSEGAVIRGKVAFKSVDATTTALPQTTGGSYGFGGIEIEVGSTYADAGEADWELTIEEGGESVEIEIPKVSQSFTFINDFWVTEVIKPA